jgi:hypothetical protein
MDRGPRVRARAFFFDRLPGFYPDSSQLIPTHCLILETSVSGHQPLTKVAIRFMMITSIRAEDSSESI